MSIMHLLIHYEVKDIPDVSSDTDVVEVLTPCLKENSGLVFVVLKKKKSARNSFLLLKIRSAMVYE